MRLLLPIISALAALRNRSNPKFVAKVRIVHGRADARDGHFEAGILDMAEGIRLWKAMGFEN